jgi:hypothetical protein
MVWHILGRYFGKTATESGVMDKALQRTIKTIKTNLSTNMFGSKTCTYVHKSDVAFCNG